MNRLHEKSYISDPRSKAKSVIMSDAGAKRAVELLRSFSFRHPNPDKPEPNTDNKIECISCGDAEAQRKSKDFNLGFYPGLHLVFPSVVRRSSSYHNQLS
jgi:hypothetical protein